MNPPKEPAPDSKQKKKPYQRPELRAFGSVRELTQAITGTMGMDLGVAPMNRMTCVSAASFLDEHRNLLNDPTQEIFRKAIFAQVKPGDVVLDLGTGSGLHAMFACQAGAKKVYAIESEPVIELARLAVKRNGFSDRIEFIHEISSKVELPEKVDVIITNIGYLGILLSLPDAKARFLKPGGKLIPGSVTNSFVPVSAPKQYEEWFGVWNKPIQGLDFADLSQFSTSMPMYYQFEETNFCAEPRSAPPIDYHEAPLSVFHWSLNFEIKSSAPIHGIMGWYEFNLGHGQRFSTKPPLAFSPEIWTQYFFPFPKPLQIEAGKTLRVDFTMAPHGRTEEPIWKWEAFIDDQRQSQQSNFESGIYKFN